MYGQLTRAILTAFLGGLLLAGCSAGGKAQVDAPPPPSPPDAGQSPQLDVSQAVQPDGGTQPDSDGTDAGCDEDAMGTDWCIKNWPSNVGGGEIVTRQKPVDYNTCKL